VADLHRRNKKRLLRYKSIVFIVTIVILSSMGVSYGVWGENLNINVAIKTGYMDTQFKDFYETENECGSLTIEKMTITNDNKHIDIQGSCTSGYKGSITIEIINNGTVPIYSEKTGEILPEQTGRYTLYIEPEYNGIQSIDSLQIDYENFDIESIMEELDLENKYTIDEQIIFQQYTNP